MKIALFHNLPSGGARRHTREQLRGLTARGYHVVEFAPAMTESTSQPFEPYVRERRAFPDVPVRVFQPRVRLLTPYIHALQGWMNLRSIDASNRVVAAEIDRGGFDLAFVKDCQVAMNPYVLRYLGTPSVFQCHHGLRHHVENQRADGRPRGGAVDALRHWYYAPARAWFWSNFATDEGRNIRSASLVLTNSQFSRALLAARYGIDARVVYPGIRTDTFAPRPSPKEDYVLCVGALIYSKGYRFLVQAISLIPSARRPRLFIAANTVEPDEERVVRADAQKLGVELHVEEITDDQRLVEVYSQAKAFVYAPVQEALGMAPLEAMACGTPVVAVAEGGVQETVLDGQAGWLVRRDPRAFAERLSTLLQDDRTRARMGEAGVEYVRSTWTWERSIDNLEQQFQSLLGTPCPTRIRTPA